MITDTEIKLKGIQILAEHLGDVEAERFIALIQREPFDYTKWRQGLDESLTIESISQRAMELRRRENAEQDAEADRYFAGAHSGSLASASGCVKSQKI